MTKRKKIALFGGSFNPPHEGHREIIRRLALRKSIDEIWVLPVYKHPFGKRLPSFDQRIKNCRFWFRTGGSSRHSLITPPLPPSYIKRGVIKKIKIKTYEKRPAATGYTIDLIHYLKEKFPNYRFWWIMGGDTYKERRQWKDFNQLKKLVRFIVFPRGHKSPIPNISSTEIRKKRALPKF